MIIKRYNRLLNILIAIVSVMMFSACDNDPSNDIDVTYMEEATVYAGPQDGGVYDEAQTSITLLWKGHSLSWSTAFVYPPHIFVSNVTAGDDKKVSAYECEFTSLEGGGLNGVVVNFADIGVTQVRGELYGSYEMVEGEFEITIPAGFVESASVEYNPEQKIRFKQVKKH